MVVRSRSSPALAGAQRRGRAAVREAGPVHMWGGAESSDRALSGDHSVGESFSLRLLQQKPDLYLLDEPCCGVDGEGPGRPDGNTGAESEADRTMHHGDALLTWRPPFPRHFHEVVLITAGS